ncbi:hypothetical protein FJZ53_06065 [Candidatus Woesearchaeota archaeon]|nr:hypothetical protein [Candidatus Woesearchaeota archaeon]
MGPVFKMLILLVITLSVFSYLFRDELITKYGDISIKYFKPPRNDIIEFKADLTCSDADIRVSIKRAESEGVYLDSSSVWKQEECVKVCKEKGFVYYSYGCFEDYFTCYCENRII